MLPGATFEDFSAPLFIAWQLTNRCSGRCPACCEESGPDKGWADELSRAEALDVARQLTEAGIPYVAFGGGEPLGVPHAWEIFDVLSEAGTAIKIETDGRYVDEAAADRLAGLRVDNAQISVDGARPETHALMRPGSATFEQATGALQRLSRRGVPAELVFVPTRHNLDEAVATFDLAVELGCSAFVTGPLMRLGRAAHAWDELAPSAEAWAETERALRARAAAHADAATRLSIYPYDIESEVQQRLDSPQAMMLIVPNGRVKLLNALPFAPGDLRRQSVLEAWRSYQRGWRSPEVAAFIRRCRDAPELLRHANETWAVSDVDAG
jgi:MoaA/NifB/PqqE/SkfB family radical SAM enzyme